MTIRVYDISKKLGLEPKAVLATAKKLGSRAREFLPVHQTSNEADANRLEQQLRKDHLCVPPEATSAN